MNTLLRLLIVSIPLLFASAFSHAEYVVIVNANNSATVTQQDVKNLYLAKAKAFSDGAEAKPVNQKEGSSIREQFDNEVAGKSSSQMKAYWAKLVFTGKAVPIEELSDDSSVVANVSQNANAIGYVEKSSVNDGVKVLFSF